MLICWYISKTVDLSCIFEEKSVIVSEQCTCQYTTLNPVKKYPYRIFKIRLKPEKGGGGTLLKPKKNLPIVFCLFWHPKHTQPARYVPLLEKKIILLISVWVLEHDVQFWIQVPPRTDSRIKRVGSFWWQCMLLTCFKTFLAVCTQ